MTIQEAYETIIAKEAAREDGWRFDVMEGEVYRFERPVGSPSGCGRFYVEAYGHKLLRSRIIAGAVLGRAVPADKQVDHRYGNPLFDGAIQLDIVDRSENLRRAAKRPGKVIDFEWRRAIVDALRSKPTAQVARENRLPVRTVQHIAKKAKEAA